MHIDWKKMYDNAMDWLISYGPKILLGVAVFIVGMLLIRVVNRWVKNAMNKKKVNLNVRYFLQNVIVLTLQVLLLVSVLQIMGLQLTVLSAIIAGFTVAAGLALSGTLQNFVSGILILILKPYRVGDNIIAQGQEGTVTTIEIFYTVVLTYDNQTIIIPNGQLSNNVVVNLSKEGKRRMDIKMRFDYETDVSLVKNTMLKAVTDEKNTIHEMPPRVGVSELEAERYVVTINVWTKAHGYYDTRILLQERIIEELKKAGVKLPTKD